MKITVQISELHRNRTKSLMPMSYDYTQEDELMDAIKNALEEYRGNLKHPDKEKIYLVISE